MSWNDILTVVNTGDTFLGIPVLFLTIERLLTFWRRWRAN